MATAAIDRNMVSVYENIHAWSVSRKAWQRDALRRLVVDGALTSQDVDDLVKICLAEHGIEKSPSPQPLLLEHLPKSATRAEPVTIRSISEVANIDALAAAQRIEFGPTGLSIVYGDNGAGKSSYARVLKRLCRARGGARPLRGNAYQNAPTRTVPSARVDFGIGTELHSEAWRELKDAVPPGALANVCVFDTTAATALVATASPAPFMPEGLDLLQGLAEACGSIGRQLNHKLDLASAGTKDWTEFPQGTSVAKALAGLTHRSNIKDFEALATLGPDELARRENLGQQLAELAAHDPTKTIAMRTARAQRLDRMALDIVIANAALADDAVAKIEALRRTATSARSAAGAARSAALGTVPIASTGGNEWRALWDSARSFSASVAYVDRAFPVTDEDAVCLLCQQPFYDQAARDRVRAFESFVQSDLEQKARTAEGLLGNALVSFDALAALSWTDGHQHLVELESLSPPAHTAVRTFCVAARERTRLMRCADKDSADLDAIAAMPVLDAGVAATIKSLAATDRAAAEELRKNDNPEARTKLGLEKANLDARVRLAARLADVKAEIERLQLQEKLRACVRETNPADVTRKTTELTKQFVTDALGLQFEEELTTLGVRGLNAKYVPRTGSRGTLPHQVLLENSSTGVADVASEGEHRGTALAAFLAELATSPVKHAIVFDDPISSLDHLRRDRVAYRLVKEAADRQVIVFSHDIAFVLMLTEAAKKLSVATKYCRVVRQGQTPGFCGDDLPWIALNTSDRVGRLKAMVQKLRADHRNAAADLDVRTRRIYGLLREAWERAIEERLLNEAVVRLRRGVETQRLKGIRIEPTDIAIIDANMSRCSAIFEGHDEAASINAGVPEPDDVAQDVNALELWVKQLSDRPKKAPASVA